MSSSVPEPLQPQIDTPSGQGPPVRQNQATSGLASTMEPSSAKTAYRPEIDGLRAVAVIAVIVNHFEGRLLPSGYLGVDIFFVISGYVITASLLNHESRRLTEFLLMFFERRVRRLVPALCVFVLTIGVAIYFISPSPQTYLKTGISSLFAVANIYMIRQASDYFAVATELNPFAHTWSLGVEEQFYLLFPVLLFFCLKSRSSSAGEMRLLRILAVLALLSACSFVVLHRLHHSIAYYSVLTRFWELSAGCLVFLLGRNSARFEGFLRRTPSTPVLALLVALLWLPRDFAVPATMAAVLLSGLLIATIRPDDRAHAWLTARGIVYLGRISYSLYLWHWGILVSMRLTIGVGVLAKLLGLAATFAVSAASYRYVETPFRTRPEGHARQRAFLVAGSGTAVVAGALWVFSLPGIYSPPRSLVGIPVAEPWIQIMDCWGRNTRKLDSPFEYCLRDRQKYPSDKPARLYWLGDSKAAQMLPMSEAATAGSAFQTAFIRSFLKNDIVDLLAGAPGEWTETPTGKAIIEQSRSGDVVAVLIKRDRWGLAGDIGAAELRQRIAAVEVQLARLIRALDRKGVKVLLVRDTPELARSISIETCFLQEKLAGRNHCDIDPDFDLQLRAPQDAMYTRLAGTLRSEGIPVFEWDPRDLFVKRRGKYSFLLDGGRYSMYDYVHLSHEGSRNLGVHFRRYLESSGLIP